MIDIDTYKTLLSNLHGAHIFKLQLLMGATVGDALKAEEKAIIELMEILNDTPPSTSK
ncbi:hypothetical protein [Klebsiella aerogenes]|uniref:hypothetical protein n=1 Tax=Klebsiella aerogenes TaxID=548 RepID=UPI0018671A92|nr:hypothetical protein [Klebsiella aerogenes]